MGRYWSQLEKDTCIKLLLEKVTYDEIAKIINKTTKSIKSKNEREFHIKIRDNDINTIKTIFEENNLYFLENQKFTTTKGKYFGKTIEGYIVYCTGYNLKNGHPPSIFY